MTDIWLIHSFRLLCAFAYSWCRVHILRTAFLIGALSSRHTIFTAAITDTQNRKRARTVGIKSLSFWPRIMPHSPLVSNQVSDLKKKKKGSAYDLNCSAITECRWIPGLNAGCWDRRGSWSWWATQTLGASGWSMPIWAAAIIRLAAMESRGGAVRVVDCIRLGWISCLRPAGYRQSQVSGEFTHCTCKTDPIVHHGSQDNTIQAIGTFTHRLNKQ